MKWKEFMVNSLPRIWTKNRKKLLPKECLDNDNNAEIDEENCSDVETNDNSNVRRNVATVRTPNNLNKPSFIHRTKLRVSNNNNDNNKRDAFTVAAGDDKSRVSHVAKNSAIITNPKFNNNEYYPSSDECATPRTRTRIKTNPWIKRPGFRIASLEHSLDHNSCSSSSQISSMTSSIASRSSSIDRINEDEVVFNRATCCSVASSTSDLGSELTSSIIYSEYTPRACSRNLGSISLNRSAASLDYETTDDEDDEVVEVCDKIVQTDPTTNDYESQFEMILENADCPHFSELNASGECGSCFSLQRLQTEMSAGENVCPSSRCYLDSKDDFFASPEIEYDRTAAGVDVARNDGEISDGDAITRQLEYESEPEDDYTTDEDDNCNIREARRSADEADGSNSRTSIVNYFSLSDDEGDHDRPYSSRDWSEADDVRPGSAVSNRRRVTDIKTSLYEKVLKLRQEKIIVDMKVRQRQEEKDIRRKTLINFRRQVSLRRKEVLRDTLADLRSKLENQCTRLQASYDTVLTVQKDLIISSRQASPREAFYGGDIVSAL